MNYFKNKRKKKAIIEIIDYWEDERKPIIMNPPPLDIHDILRVIENEYVNIHKVDVDDVEAENESNENVTSQHGNGTR